MGVGVGYASRALSMGVDYDGRNFQWAWAMMGKPQPST